MGHLRGVRVVVPRGCENCEALEGRQGKINPHRVACGTKGDKWGHSRPVTAKLRSGRSWAAWLVLYQGFCIGAGDRRKL